MRENRSSISVKKHGAFRGQLRVRVTGRDIRMGRPLRHRRALRWDGEKEPDTFYRGLAIMISSRWRRRGRLRPRRLGQGGRLVKTAPRNKWSRATPPPSLPLSPSLEEQLAQPLHPLVPDRGDEMKRGGGRWERRRVARDYANEK